MFSQAICNRAGWDENWTDFKKKGGLQAVYKPPEGAGVCVWGGGGEGDLTNIWVWVSRWGFGTLTLFKDENIAKTSSILVPCLGQLPNFIIPRGFIRNMNILLGDILLIFILYSFSK